MAVALRPCAYSLIKFIKLRAYTHIYDIIYTGAKRASIFHPAAAGRRSNFGAAQSWQGKSKVTAGRKRISVSLLSLPSDIHISICEPKYYGEYAGGDVCVCFFFCPYIPLVNYGFYRDFAPVFDGIARRIIQKLADAADH